MQVYSSLVLLVLSKYYAFFFFFVTPLYLVCVQIREPSPTGNTLQVQSEQSEFCILKPLNHVLFVIHIVCLLNILIELLFILGFT